MNDEIKKILGSLSAEDIKEKAAGLLAAKSAEDVKTVLSGCNIELNDELCGKLLSELKEKVEISDDALSFVAGGIGHLKSCLADKD